MSDPSVTPPARRKFSAGHIAMIIVGALLLLPGGCALVFFIGGVVSGDSWRFDDPIAQMVLAVWAISLAISAIGVVLIVLAFRRARRMS
jgi:membrane protein implicated in regulation of membrane protease activity